MATTNVTQREHTLTPNALLVSYTDLQGNIIKANEAFVEASGYGWAELINQPHNILRHPDVPKQVFADLWDTIQAGRPWAQIVKNRRKNGDHYWVVARTTPMFDKAGNITGYMSVRRPANPAQIQQAQAAYQAIHQGRIRLKNGRVDSLKNRLNSLAHLNPQWTVIPTGIISLATYILDVFGIHIGNTAHLIITLLAVFAAVHALYFIHRIKDSIHAVNLLSNGDFDTPINTFGENIAGTLARKLCSMQVRLGDSVNSTQETLLKSQRLEQALGLLHGNVMVVDQNNTIVYTNPSLVSLLQRLHPSAQSLVGQCIDVLHQDDQDPFMRLANIQETSTNQITLSGHPLQLIINPITNDQQQRIGVVIEWQDIFMEQKIQADLKNLIQGAAQGNFNLRMPTQELSGFYLDLANQFNQLLNATEKALWAVATAMNKLSQGDLTAKIECTLGGSLGELNHKVNQSIAHLGQTLAMIMNNMKHMTHHVEHLSEANQQGASRTQETAASLQQSAASIEEMSASLQRANGNTQQATNYAQHVRQSAEKGVLVVNDSVVAMSEIENHSRRIEEITGLIDSIAFQTNLLALNAAVEAARAGEHGRGFAVVAGEVRALAAKSATAANDIKHLIEETVSKIHTGAQKVQSTAEVLSEIEQHVTSVSRLIEDIASTTIEQTHAMHNVQQTINHIDQMTQQNAVQSDNLAKMSHSMNQQAQEVSQALQAFVLPAISDNSNIRHLHAHAHKETTLIAPVQASSA